MPCFAWVDALYEQSQMLSCPPGRSKKGGGRLLACDHIILTTPYPHHQHTTKRRLTKICGRMVRADTPLRINRVVVEGQWDGRMKEEWVGRRRGEIMDMVDL